MGDRGQHSAHRVTRLAWVPTDEASYSTHGAPGCPAVRETALTALAAVADPVLVHHHLLTKLCVAMDRGVAVGDLTREVTPIMLVETHKMSMPTMRVPRDHVMVTSMAVSRDLVVMTPTAVLRD